MHARVHTHFDAQSDTHTCTDTPKQRRERERERERRYIQRCTIHGRLRDKAQLTGRLHANLNLDPKPGSHLRGACFVLVEVEVDDIAHLRAAAVNVPIVPVKWQRAMPPVL